LERSPTLLEALKEKALSWNLEQWISECAKLENYELATLLPLASQETHDPSWKEKLLQLFMHLPANVHNDTFAKVLQTTQIMELIDFVKNNHNLSNRLKLSGLFTAIPPTIFKDLLIQSPPNELAFLREEAFTEAIQHNLSLITNELSNQFEDFCKKITLAEIKIAEIDLTCLDKNEITAIYHSMDNFHKEGKNILDLSSKALALAWNANRLDLIQELGKIKELCQKCLLTTVGYQSDNETTASGLFYTLEQKIDQLFSDKDSNGNINLMDNSTPALEALVKFSVWYIRDYCDIGLLPQIQSSECQGNEDEEGHNLKNREQLFITAEKNLTDLGLRTLADLKAAHIYSKKALIEYIQKR
jgi:hypothetical protein